MMTHPVFHNGFRPFFLGGAVFAAASIALWVAVITGLLSSVALSNPLDWHAHEMVFGFFGAILGGFLLTAMPSWSNQPPITGARLRFLFLTWVAGRLFMLMFLFSNPDVFALALGIALVDLLYPVLLVIYAIGQVSKAPAIHNFPVVFMVGLLAVADLLFHLAPLIGILRSRGPYLGLVVATILMALIGGRVIPNFTRNWLQQHKSPLVPAEFGKFDMIAVGAALMGMVGWLVLPDYMGTGIVLAVASVLGLVRLSRWHGIHTWAQPLVLILHVGYLWLVAGLAALSVSVLMPNILPTATALHVLTTGAIGTMVLAIMTRATRGHTGRPLLADGVTVLIYVLVNLGAILRVTAPFLPLDYSLAIGLSGLVWGSAFIVFAIAYGPWLVKPRI